MLLFQILCPSVGTVNSYHEAPEIVTYGNFFTKKIGQCVVRFIAVFSDLLAQAVKPCSLLRAIFIGPDDQVVTVRVRWEKAEDPSCLEQVLGDDHFQHFISLEVELLCLSGLLLVPSLEHFLLIFPDAS